MSLENLVSVNRLVKHYATSESIRKLIDTAYKAIMQCAMAALWAKGCRTLTS